ncbi:MAG TPA: phage holin family protein [Pyrinomonadaceae bacterium]|nr:phage holin family protein [Pyrinomonadaceae bacterium]
MAQTQMQMNNKDERSLGDLFSELAAETGTLVRQEVALAQAEITTKATKVGKNVGFLAVGGAVAYAAMLAILAGVIIGLSHFMPAWIAAILVGLVVGAVAFFMISSSLAELKNTNLKPEETVDSIKEDAQWLKDQVS